MTCFCRAVFEMSVDQGALFGRVNISLKCRERSELERDAGMVTREVPGKAPGWRHHLQQRSDLSFKPTNKARMVREMTKKEAKRVKGKEKEVGKEKLVERRRKLPLKHPRPGLPLILCKYLWFCFLYPFPGHIAYLLVFLTIAAFQTFQTSGNNLQCCQNLFFFNLAY